MTSVFSWQNSISLCPASFCIPSPNWPVTPGVSRLPTFAFQSPIIKRTSFFDYCDIEWFVLETNRDHSVIFEIAYKYCILDSLVDYDSNSISPKGFLPIVVDIMVI